MNPRGTYKHHLEVSIDTGADVNCMNEKTFKKLFPKVDLSVCPHSIQNFGNSTADVYILGQFHTYLKFRGRKYLNTFIVTNANDCPNILSHGAIFRMGILVPNYLGGEYGKSKRHGDRYIQCFSGLTRSTDAAVPREILGPGTHRPGTTFYDHYNQAAKSFKNTEKIAKQPARKQVHTLTICLRFRLLFRTIPTPESNTAHSTRRPASSIHQPHSHSELQSLLHACIPATEQDSQDGRTVSLRRSQASTQG